MVRRKKKRGKKNRVRDAAYVAVLIGLAVVIYLLQRSDATPPDVETGEPDVTASPPDHEPLPLPVPGVDLPLLSDKDILPAVENPRIHVFKRRRELRLYDGATWLRTYRCCVGARVEGDKEREGDRTTPEGEFFVCTRNEASRFHLFLGLSYPAPDDAARGLEKGMITEAEHREIMAAHRGRRQPPWKTALGGEVGIHGKGGTPRTTLGCVALADEHVEELWKVVPLGTPVTIER